MISVVIPNWNGIVHLPSCLNALRAQTHPEFEVIVADNASDDGSQELVQREYPEFQLLALDRNYGFTGACNAGIRAAQGEIVVLLNNDTEAAPDWLAQVAAAFERHPDVGSVASKMLLFDRRDTLHTAGDLYGTDGIPSNRGVWAKDTNQYTEGYVFSACGGAAAYRRAMLDEVGLLDEDFFFSCEDVDLGWRAQLRGWRTVYAPAAIVYHHLAATGAGVTASFHDGRNFIYVLVKDVPGFIWRRYWPKIAAAQLRLAGAALRAWRGPAARARLRGQLAGLAAIPRLLHKRRAVQASRTVTDDYIESVLTG
ncbi:MAG: glycosyltransferase family 2 protein [Anaerolineales bacterium]